MTITRQDLEDAANAAGIDGQSLWSPQDSKADLWDLAEKWNAECDEFREDNKRLAAELEIANRIVVANEAQARKFENELAALKTNLEKCRSASERYLTSYNIALEDITNLAKRNKLMEEELAALKAGSVEKDAARYRWFRLNLNNPDVLQEVPSEPTPEELDDAIDAAMAAGEI